MSPFYLALVLVVISSVYSIVNFVLPSLNLHSAMTIDTALEIKAQNILDQSRGQSYSQQQLELPSLLKKLEDEIPGIEILKVKPYTSDQYVNVEIFYRYNNLFKNKFFDSNKSKSFVLMIDKAHFIGEGS